MVGPKLLVIRIRICNQGARWPLLLLGNYAFCLHTDKATISLLLRVQMRCICKVCSTALALLRLPCHSQAVVPCCYPWPHCVNPPGSVGQADMLSSCEVKAQQAGRCVTPAQSALHDAQLAGAEQLSWMQVCKSITAVLCRSSCIFLVRGADEDLRHMVLYER